MEQQPLRVIITGASGMVGEGVLHECLNSPHVEHVVVLGRKPCGHKHPKLTEIIHSDFLDITPIADQLQNYNACFFCLGVSSIGLSEQEYVTLTHTLTLHVAEILARQNPDMTFCYVSGKGTDGTEKGNSMWARVKGKTENDVMKLPFKRAFAFRPGYIHPTKGLLNTLSFYKYIMWLYPVLKVIAPSYGSTLREIGLAMIRVATKGYSKNVLEVPDIIDAAK